MLKQYSPLPEDGTPSIAFLASNEDMAHAARCVLAAEHGDIRIVQGQPGGGASRMAEELARQGVEIIIARSGKAMDIREEGLPLMVVDLPVSAFDVIRAVNRVRHLGRRIGMVAFPDMAVGLDKIAQAMDVELRYYPLIRKADPAPQLEQARRDGVDAVIGGYITQQRAGAFGLHAELITNEPESILQAAQEAKRLAEAQSREKARAELFKTLLDYSHEGMITVDENARVLAFNPMACRIMGLEQDALLGRPIDEVWPELSLSTVVTTGQDELWQLLRINGVDVLCQKVAVKVKKRSVAAVAIFQDIVQIQNTEAKVRQHISETGHHAMFTFDTILGESEPLRRTVSMAKDYAMTDSSVLLLGESGTGKEMFAQSIHALSQRRHGPFVAVNCAALPGQLLESELFGYMGGAFTGANPKGKLGLFELAHQGTLLLDEIAEMDVTTQGKLLRALQERAIRRLGGDRLTFVDVRILAATNKPLRARMAEGRFREDLYYRLNVLPLSIPPLRERPEDILLLARHFLQRHPLAQKRGLAFAPAALRILCEYAWPGNIRELQSVIERIVATQKSRTITADQVAELMQSAFEKDACSETPSESSAPALTVKQALRVAKGKHGVAAELLGISRTTLWRRLQQGSD